MVAVLKSRGRLLRRPPTPLHQAHDVTLCEFVPFSIGKPKMLRCTVLCMDVHVYQIQRGSSLIDRRTTCAITLVLFVAPVFIVVS